MIDDPGNERAACRGETADGPRGEADEQQDTPGLEGLATLITGCIIDREYSGSTEELSKHIESTMARSLFEAFRRSESMRYLVLAGHLHRANGGACGGMAAGWDQAKALFAFCGIRLDELASDSTESFASKWFLFCDNDKRDEIAELVANAGRPAAVS